MSILRFFGRRLVSLLLTLAILIGLVCLFVLSRLMAPAQQDDQYHLSEKHSYLKSLSAGASTAGADRPNIIFILYDDLGYGDIGIGSSDQINTPNIDLIAAQGVSLSDFHSPSSVCTPSRTGFLTGRLAPRAGLPNVVFPTGSTNELIASKLFGKGTNLRLPAEEITLADILRAAGYKTGMVGKWHLGDQSPSLPNDMGFDSFYGALYSNDMQPFAFYRDTEISLKAPVDQRKMSEIYTQEATDFIEANADEPFFLYFAHNFPHLPLFTPDERSGKSAAGLYGDVIEELDDGIGRIKSALEKTGQLDNTLIIITSDNGPWFLGDAGDSRGRKGSVFEGGMRVPFIAHWPGNIEGGRIETTMSMGTDLVPTLLDMLGLAAPSDRVLDGSSILNVLTASESSSKLVNREYLYYYAGEKLIALRDQRFKYRAPANLNYGPQGFPMGINVPQKEWLFDLSVDPRESYDASTHYPDELTRLRGAYEAKVSEMAENKRGWR